MHQQMAAGQALALPFPAIEPGEIRGEMRMAVAGPRILPPRGEVPGQQAGDRPVPARRRVERVQRQGLGAGGGRLGQPPGIGQLSQRL